VLEIQYGEASIVKDIAGNNFFRLNGHLTDPLSLKIKQGSPLAGRQVKPSFITRPFNKDEMFSLSTFKMGLSIQL